MTAVNLAGFFHMSQKAASRMLQEGSAHCQHYGYDCRTAYGLPSCGPCRFDKRRPQCCHTLPRRTIQGGIITAMLDDAMGPVATAFLGGYHVAPTVELKTNFMRPATVGPLFVEAKVVHRGDMGVLEGAMKDKKDKLIATATATARLC